jgi:tetratricopeptide (TPR) repeat protein
VRRTSCIRGTMIALLWLGLEGAKATSGAIRGDMANASDAPGVVIIGFGLLALGFALGVISGAAQVTFIPSGWWPRALAAVIGIYLCGYGAWLLHPVKLPFLLAVLPTAAFLTYLAIALLAGWPPFVKSSQQYLETGIEHLRNKDYKSAEGSLENSLKRLQQDHMTRPGEVELGLAEALEGEGRRTDAADHYTKAAADLRKEPTEWDGATEALKGLVNLDPTNREAWQQLAAACKNLRDWPCAEKGLEAALNLRPADGSVYDELSGVLTQMGRPDQAAVMSRVANDLNRDASPLPIPLNLRVPGNPDVALDTFERIDAGLQTPLGDDERAACSANPDTCNIGYFAKEFGILLNSQGLYYRALHEFEMAKRFGRNHEVYVLAGIGEAYRKLDKNDKACPYYDEAVAAANEDHLPDELQYALGKKLEARCP